MTQKVTSFLKGVREYVYPVLQNSAFLERGVLTPAEFVEAGDQLVYRCPTWRWEGGEPSKAKSYLPLDKQYLVTRNVPCHRRATVFAKEYMEETEVEGLGGEEEGEGGEDPDGGWLATHINPTDGGGSSGHAAEEVELGTPGAGGGSAPTVLKAGEDGGSLISFVDEHFAVDKREGGGGKEEKQGSREGLPAATTTAASSTRNRGREVNDEEQEEGYADMASYEDTTLLAADEATLQPLPYLKAEEPVDALLSSRTYDISITYDKYYQTPRAWLLGYNEEEQVLTSEMMFEDIMQDYANRTVTIESHPHTGTPQASIHPCQHGNVMKNIIQNLSAGGKVPRTDQYIFIFLKFVQSVIPTIEYDFTIEVEGRS